MFYIPLIPRKEKKSGFYKFQEENLAKYVYFGI